MQLEGRDSLLASHAMKEAGVQLTQRVIPDDASLRRGAIVDVVSLYCSDLVFPPGSCVTKAGPPACSNACGAVEDGLCHVVEENGAAGDLCVRRLSGGITNELFRVYHPSDHPHSVVVRVFGRETERVISRESEFFYQSLFIPTYVRGRNFLIYQFLDRYEALPFTDMPLEARKVACEVAAFQVRATLESKCDRQNPHLSEEERAYWDTVGPTLGSNPSSACGTCRFDREENYTLHALTKWAEQMTSEVVLKKVGAGKRADYEDVARQLEGEASWMRQLLLRHASSLGESVCHNDLLSANIMRHRADGVLKIIDFDYVKRNYFLFDIANHFNEYAGMECDYERHFPSDEGMSSFIGAYRKAMRVELLKHRDDARCRELDEIIPGQSHFFMCATNMKEGGEDKEEEEQQTIAHWVRLVKLLTLASHLSWGIWALLQEAVSALDVDFLVYAKRRLRRYLETKYAFSAGFG